MAHKKFLEVLNTTLKNLRRDNQLMEEVLVLLCDFFRETFPVTPKTTPANEIYAKILNSLEECKN